MFRNLEDYDNDPIEGMFVRLAADTDPAKIDLGIGVYRDADGNVPVMAAVRRAEQALFEKNLPKSYMSPLGNAGYCEDVKRLALGEDHAVLKDGRVVSAQTPGAGSALRAAAELVSSLSPGARLWASQPVWGHQLEFFESAGMEIKSYRYYDQMRCVMDFDGMLADLANMQANDILLLHGCCHNPTGQDLDAGQWSALADLVRRTGAVPFVDIAYQGFGRGIDEDVAGLRLLAAEVPQLLLTVSSSKSFGIYRERAGLLSVILEPGAGNRQSVQRKLRDTVRQLYFMPPNHGAAIVHEILSSPELTESWRRELDEIRGHVVNMRSALKRTIEEHNPGFDAGFLVNQQGMFSCLPMTAAEQRRMEEVHHIYMLPNARVNVAAMNDKQSTTLALAFRDICAERERPDDAQAAAGV